MNHVMQPRENTGIMQLMERYHQDTRPDKLNLTAGVYTDESGCSPILDTVREAEWFRIENQTSKASFHLIGAPEFHKAVRTVLFPTMKKNDENLNVQVIQTLGASGALHLAGRLINHYAPTARVWLSVPTWENHPAIFSIHSGGIGYYRYQPANQEQLCMDTILEDLQLARPGDFVVLHACCHNPTGMDPSPSQWKELAEFCSERKLIPIFDFAYQGFAHSIRQDAELFVTFRKQLDMFIICSSFSKNMGIYNERTGAMTLVFKEAEKLKEWIKTAKKLIRSIYSTPPVHGGFIVSHIINDPLRFARWQQEVAGMRNDLERRRALFLSELTDIGIMDKVLSYRRQQGMFLCLNLSQQKIDTLREKHGVYLLDNGRMCIASLSTENIPRYCEALKRVIKHCSFDRF